MVNYDGLYELNIKYDVTISSRAFSHVQTLDVALDGEPNVGDAFSAIPAIQKNGTNVFLDDWVETYLLQFVEFMGSGTSQPEIELWKYDPEPSVEKTFVSSYTPASTLVYVGTPVAAHSLIFTFRTMGGGVARTYFMEDISSLETRVASGSLTGDSLAYKNFMVAGTSIVVGRDNAYLNAGIALNYGQNEALRRKRFRTT